jgi:alpha-galactosidase
MYTINGESKRYSGAALMYAGLPINREVPEYTAFQFHLQIAED